MRRERERIIIIKKRRNKQQESEQEETRCRQFAPHVPAEGRALAEWAPHCSEGVETKHTRSRTERKEEAKEEEIQRQTGV